MTEPPKIRKRILLVGPMILAGLVLSGCLGRPAAPRGASTAESSKARAADRVATLPSAASGVYTRLRLGDPQHSYIFESRGE